MYLLQQLNIHSNIRDQMTDGYMYVGQPTYNYTWFSRYVCMPAMLYEIYNREVHGTKQQHIVREMFSLVVLLNTYYGNTGCGVFKRGIQN